MNDMKTDVKIDFPVRVNIVGDRHEILDAKNRVIFRMDMGASPTPRDMAWKALVKARVELMADLLNASCDGLKTNGNGVSLLRHPENVLTTVEPEKPQEKAKEAGDNEGERKDGRKDKGIRERQAERMREYWRKRREGK